jgi:WASH complex subunit CCDC53
VSSTSTTIYIRFSFLCEQKLMNVSTNIQQLEITLALLEAKLQSIEANNAGSTPTNPTTTTATTPEGQVQPVTADPAGATGPAPVVEEAVQEAPAAPSLTWRRDPRYSKFFSLLEMGVPIGQIQRDMMLKGMDPSILEYDVT